MAASDAPGAVTAGILCGTGAAVAWAFGFVAGRHGIDIGFAPADLTLHRFLWGGLALLPLLWRAGLSDLGGIGWGRGLVLTVLGGPGLALISYSGFLLVPLGHGGVIQPSCAALFGLLLAWRVLGEPLPPSRAIGAAIIVCGLAVIGAEALATIGAHGLAGDLMFATAGAFFASFGTLLRRWRIEAMRATVAVTAAALVALPLYAAAIGFDRIVALGWRENLIQALVQGILAGPAATYLFVRSVALLGAGRAAVFPSLVPGFTLLIGFLFLGEVPSALQLIGFAVVLVGFRMAQRM